ncbi:hypothetical protein SeMB42_g05701 [Synchytrium endobioticum]|uniref:Uncharacterized protein n=1 Tax=Synchytrium endobioticum TaxID=286115 RepID=A0A507CPV4_9FUNG|nr:hypothetical protein SeMB42_g05701 [Synchytrium endobioticum]
MDTGPSLIDLDELGFMSAESNTTTSGSSAGCNPSSSSLFSSPVASIASTSTLGLRSNLANPCCRSVLASEEALSNCSDPTGVHDSVVVFGIWSALPLSLTTASKSLSFLRGTSGIFGSHNLYPLNSWFGSSPSYPIKMHLTALGSSFFLNSFGTNLYATHPKTLILPVSGFSPKKASYGVVFAKADVAT